MFRTIESERRLKVTWPEPPALLAVTVTLAGAKEPGVPVMAPLAEFSVRPVGSAGLTDQLVAAPPLLLALSETVDWATRVNWVVFEPAGP